MEDHECPQCGEILQRCEDENGACYQCRDMGCLGLFDVDEIEKDDE